VAKGRPGAHGTGTAGEEGGREELERRARVRWTGLWRRKAANERQHGHGDGGFVLFLRSQSAALSYHRPPYRPRTTSSIVVINNYRSCTTKPTNEQVGLVWMDMYRVGGFPLPPTLRPTLPPVAFTVYPRPSRQSPP
jgi:hypothetical protein